jgi:hypothetical protein
MSDAISRLTVSATSLEVNQDRGRKRQRQEPSDADKQEDRQTWTEIVRVQGVIAAAQIELERLLDRKKKDGTPNLDLRTSQQNQFEPHELDPLE